ncbi:MAG: hypothetical protein K0R28_8 [Paenibacillus sp.]|jgi:multiple sugar transport system substrate-binding protein|nr:hypothetical protein [Paenibacillus sp.]
MTLKKWLTAASLLTTVATASACSGDGRQPDKAPGLKPEASKEPVELVWYFASATTSTPEVLDETYVKPIQKKYPHISIKFLHNKDENAIANLVAAQTKIDLIFGSFSLFGTVKQNGLLGSDMSDLIKSRQFDLNRIDDSYLKLMRDMNDGKLAGLPLYDIRRVLYYNKDIFDKFGVPYPKDGMTWEQTLELAKKLTRTDGGVQYRGLIAPPGGFVPTNQYSLPYLDPQTKKAALATDKWKTFIETYVPFYTMPGYEATKMFLGNSTNQENLFFKEQSAAMLVKFNSDAAAVSGSLPNWDAVTFPEMSDMKGVGSQPYPVYLAMASTIQPNRREAAFLVMQELLSDEVQKGRAATGLASPLKSAEAKAAFGQNLDVWAGKNIKAVTAQQPAPPVAYHDYNRFGQSAIGNAMISVIAGEKDVNTALREAEAQMNKQIAEEEAKK